VKNDEGLEVCTLMVNLFRRKEKKEKVEEAWYCELCPHRNECSLEHKDAMRRASKDNCAGKEAKQSQA
jgi:hypothetical protein